MSALRVSHTVLDSQVLAALVYASIFSYPLTLEEIWLFLPVSEPVSKIAVGQAVDQLEKRGVIKADKFGVGDHQRKCYSLTTNDNNVKKRSANNEFSRKKQQRTRNLVKLITWWPWLHAIYITGSVAVGNASINDDIDLMIVTAPNRLWLTRLTVTVVFWLVGVKRNRIVRENKRGVADRLCLNLFLDQNQLALPKNKQNLYSAHEIIQSVLVWCRKGYFPKSLLTANIWYSRFLANASPTKVKSRVTKKNELTENRLVNWLETLCYRLQYWYLKRHITRETVTPTSAFFHPRPTDVLVLRQYHQQLLKYGIISEHEAFNPRGNYPFKSKI